MVHHKHVVSSVKEHEPARPGSRSLQVIGHRGARWLAVENTVEALRIAFEEGADGVEFDVQLTADGELVLFHDDQLKQLTGAQGRVVDWPWRDLRGLRVQDRLGRRGSMPHLEEVLELLLPMGGVINLELKVVGDNGPALTEAVVAALLAAGSPTWILSSFDRQALCRLATCAVTQPRGLLIDDDPTSHWWQTSLPGAVGGVALAEAAVAVGGHLSAIHPHANLLSPDRLELWQAADLAVNVWTLNDPQQWSRASALGVAGVITDDPGGCAAWLSRSKD